MPQKKKAKNNPQAPKMTAAQKLEAMSNLVAQHHGKFDILADEIDKLSNLLITLNKKVNAIIEAGDSGKIGKDSVSNVLLDGAVAELKSKVDELVRLKAIFKVEEAIEDERYFVVARELDKEGNVVNPRTQFAVNSLPEELRADFLNKKAGDVLTKEGSDVSVELTEVYKIASVEKEQTFEDEATEESQEAPAAEENAEKQS